MSHDCGETMNLHKSVDVSFVNYKQIQQLWMAVVDVGLKLAQALCYVISLWSKHESAFFFFRIWSKQDSLCTFLILVEV